MRTTCWMSLLVALAIPGVGRGADETARNGDPCADDVLKYCPDVKLGGSRLVECLQKNRASISPACGARIDASRQKAKALIEEFGRSCRADVDRYCPSVDPGGGASSGAFASTSSSSRSPARAR
jgi:hypothetical protein